MSRGSASLWMLVCVAAALAVPLAAAHGTAYDRQLWLDDEPILVELHGAPFPIAGETLSLQVILPLRHPDDATPVEAFFTAPNGSAGEPQEMRKFDGRYSLSARFPVEGSWTVTVRVDGKTLEDAFQVRPGGLAFFTADDRLASLGALVAGEPARLSMRVTDLHGRDVPAATDVVARVETWDPSGARLVDAQEMPAARVGEGVYEVARTWDEPALVRATLASAAWDLEHGDRPALEILVVTPEEASVYRTQEPAKQIPAAGFALTIAACAAGALALAWRRGR